MALPVDGGGDGLDSLTSSGRAYFIFSIAEVALTGCMLLLMLSAARQATVRAPGLAGDAGVSLGAVYILLPCGPLGYSGLPRGHLCRHARRRDGDCVHGHHLDFVGPGGTGAAAAHRRGDPAQDGRLDVPQALGLPALDAESSCLCAGAAVCTAAGAPDGRRHNRRHDLAGLPTATGPLTGPLAVRGRAGSAAAAAVPFEPAHPTC
eukprot:scaffold16298_cov105-Isochrysis_galbana.AAC.1